MKRYVVLGFPVMIAVAIIASGCFSTPSYDCQGNAKKIALNGSYINIERWMDKNLSNWDGKTGKMAPRHLYGYGSFVLPLPFRPKQLGLLDDAEAQAIVDLEGRVRAIQIVDSKAHIVVANRAANDWYRWPPNLLEKVDDRVGVICSKRD
jgi:hypothetical protein